jgi:5-formyltetrahydrofolate cyclo-ligase
MSTKTEIRQQIRAMRSSLDDAQQAAAAGIVQSQLLSLPAIRDGKIWFVYVSARGEISTRSLIEALIARGDAVTVPLVVGSDKIIPRQIHSLGELRLGEFGILAPPPGEPYLHAIDVCVCPGVAFSERGDRLGSGRGFYDRYLAANPPRLAIGLAFDVQVVPELPSEEQDRRMDYIITEKRVIHAGGMT